MQRKNETLLFKFSTIFVIFALSMLVLGGLLAYLSQMRTYKNESLERTKNVDKYLKSLMTEDKEAFIYYQKYFMENYERLSVPYDFHGYTDALHTYTALYSKHYADKKLGRDITYEELDPEVKEAFFQYMHRFWLTAFEEAREKFDMPYTYYIVPVKTGNRKYDVYYVIDGERTKKKGSGGKLLYLGDCYHHVAGEYPTEWKVWKSGKEIDEFQEWDNDYGHTYAYYVPLIINGEKLGLVGAEVNVADVNRTILFNTIKEISIIGGILIIGIILVVININRQYIRKIKELTDSVKDYSDKKDVEIARRIDKCVTNEDEISYLARNMSGMIRELDNYMLNLDRAKNDLKSTTEKLHEKRLDACYSQNEFTRDELTGIRNKAGFDVELQRLETEKRMITFKMGIAVIDINDFKDINEAYGHNFGDIIIKKFSHVICRVFEHSPVFRINGNRFAVILMKKDLENADELKSLFESEVKKIMLDEEGKPFADTLVAAFGMATYDNARHKSLCEVYDEASEVMEKRKVEIKKQ